MSAKSKEMVSIWPGYVAAIASLVLSLLLLLAILALAMTQVGAAGYLYTQELIRTVVENEADLEAQAIASKPLIQAALAPPGTPFNQIRFVFGADLASIPAAQAGEVAKAIQDLKAPEDARWLISASTPPSDATTEHSTFRLMLALRRTLTESNVPESLIQMRINRNATSPDDLKTGAIAITVAPLHALTKERSKP
jgi:hypothetical protein